MDGSGAIRRADILDGCLASARWFAERTRGAMLRAPVLADDQMGYLTDFSFIPSLEFLEKSQPVLLSEKQKTGRGHALSG